MDSTNVTEVAYADLFLSGHQMPMWSTAAFCGVSPLLSISDKLYSLLLVQPTPSIKLIYGIYIAAAYPLPPAHTII